MKSNLFGKYIKGQLVTLTEHQRLAAVWWHSRNGETFPSREWINRSKAHWEAQFLIADIFDADSKGREIDFSNCETE